jgi:LuxR family maltose regulon positive regulatory protein
MNAAAVGVCLAQGRPEAAVERLPRQMPDGEVPLLLALGWTKLATGAAVESGRLARQVTQQPVGGLDLHVGAHLLAAASALALGQAEPAGLSLREAVRLAAASGCRRPFDEAPRRVKSLLDQRRPALPMQAAPASPSLSPRRGGSALHVPTQARPPQGVLIQPLTEREREVLGYLDALLPTEEIAARMFVSVNTVKTHVRAILRKLSAERRNEAIRRARELGLL